MIRQAACLLLILMVLPFPTVSAQTAEVTVLRGGWLFDGTGDEVAPNPGIVVRSGKILSVGLPAELPPEVSVETIELEDDWYILPGLFDLHAHYAMDLFGEGRVDVTEGLPPLFLANGVTSTFPAGEVNPEAMRQLRLAIARGERVGPRIYNSGPYFGTWRTDWDTTMTAEEIYAEVDRWVEHGARGFKAKGASHDELKALIERAHQHGLTVTAHLGSGSGRSVNPSTAIDLGIDRVEHFLGGEPLPADRSAYASLVEVTPETPGFEAIVEKYIEHGVFFNATLTAYGYYADQEPAVYEDFADEQQYLTPYMREIRAEHGERPYLEHFEQIYRVKHETLRVFYEQGGGHLITTGTDHPSWGQYLTPFGLHRELHAFVRAGLPEAAALRAATLNSARALGVSDRLGSVEPGKWADLVVVQGNPLEDIRHTRNVQFVLKAGTRYEAEVLREQARGTIGPAGPEEEAAWKPDAN